MNEQLRRPNLPMTTQAAEGLPRRRWSVAEIEAFVESGVIAQDERLELIGGEVVPMSPKGIRHEVVKVNLNLFWAKLLPPGIKFATETTFRMSEDTFVEPDFVFYRTKDGLAGLKPETCLLAVEIADSSLAYDLGRKARIYATFAIPQAWVINAATLETRVHKQSGLDGYEDIFSVAPDAPLAPPFAPELSVVLGALPLK